MPKIYRNRQIVQAEQYTGENFSDLKQWAPVEQHEGEHHVWLRENEHAVYRVEIGDWVVRIETGEVYRFKVVMSEEFPYLYEEVQ